MTSAEFFVTSLVILTWAHPIFLELGKHLCSSNGINAPYFFKPHQFKHEFQFKEIRLLITWYMQVACAVCTCRFQQNLWCVSLSTWPHQIHEPIQQLKLQALIYAHKKTEYLRKWLYQCQYPVYDIVPQCCKMLMMEEFPTYLQKIHNCTQNISY